MSQIKDRREKNKKHKEHKQSRRKKYIIEAFQGSEGGGVQSENKGA